MRFKKKLFFRVLSFIVQSFPRKCLNSSAHYLESRVDGCISSED